MKRIYFAKDATRDDPDMRQVSGFRRRGLRHASTFVFALENNKYKSTTTIDTQIHKYKYTKYKYTNTNTQIQIHKHKIFKYIYTDTNTEI